MKKDSIPKPPSTTTGRKRRTPESSKKYLSEVRNASRLPPYTDPEEVIDRLTDEMFKRQDARKKRNLSPEEAYQAALKGE